MDVELNLDPVVPDETPTPPEENGADDAPPKRRRGRPSKNSEGLNEEKIEPGATKARPGPKKRKFGGESIEILAKQLEGIHQMAAMMMGEPIVILSTAEAVMLATAVVGIAEEYGVVLTGKMAATLQLLGVAGIIYVPRFIEIQRKHSRNPPNTVENEHSGN